MILRILKDYKKGIVFTYFIFLIEFVVFAIYPYLFGKAIDGLILQDYKNYKWYIILTILGTMIGCFRRCMDTRIFGDILYSLTGETVINLSHKSVSSSKIIARAHLVTNYIQLIESHISSLVSSIINISISFFMIYAQSPSSVISILILSLISTLSYYIISKILQTITFNIQNTNEDIYTKIVDIDIESIQNEYNVMYHHQIHRSDWESFMWGIINLSTFLAEAIIVLDIVNHQGYNEAVVITGTIMSSVAYTNRIFARIGTIGGFFNQMALIKITNQILRRDN